MIVRSSQEMALLVRLTRQQRGMTQGGLAAAIGVTRQAVSNMEAGRTTPSVALVLVALAALDLEVDVLPKRQGGGDSTLAARRPTSGAGGAPVDLDEVLAAVRDGEAG